MIGIAASTRVGNAIGSRDASGAKYIGHLSALLSALTGTLVMLSLLLSKDVRVTRVLPPCFDILQLHSDLRIPIQRRCRSCQTSSASNAARSVLPSRRRSRRVVWRRTAWIGKAAFGRYV